MCLVASNRTVASTFSGGGGDGEKNNLTEKNIQHSRCPPHPSSASSAAATATSSTIALFSIIALKILLVAKG
jgi:hypothetical protein